MSRARQIPLVITLLAAPLAASAFAPTESGTEPARVYRYDAARQLELRHRPAWVEFTQAEGHGWQARFDPITGTPHRMWGPGVRMGDTRAEVVARLVPWLHRNQRILGVDASDLSVRSANHDADSDTWYVDLDRKINGAPIWRGGVTARIKHGNLVMLGVDTYPGARMTNAPVLAASRAIAIATGEGPARHVVHENTSATPILLPEETDGEVTLRNCWLVKSTTGRPAGHPGDPPGRWNILVDAETGEVVSSWNDVRFGSGIVTGLVHERLATDPLVSAVMPDIRVRGDSTAYADDFGIYEVDSTSGSYTATFNGTYARINNEAGGEGSLTWSGGDAEWTTASATQAEIDTYKFVHDVRDWGRTVVPSNQWVSDNVVANVNMNDICNAYWDGDLNFFHAGSGGGYSCRNTGEMADVIFHEWGHGLHYYSLRSGTFDSSLSEGAADTVATFLTHDAEIAPGFFTNGDPIREVASDRVYPDNYSDAADPHENGLIFAGAMWDLWGILSDDLGDEAGTAAATSIFTGLLKAGPDIEGSFDEAVLADDDNGDLSDGTPNYCNIIEAFGRHGLGPVGGGESAISVVVTSQMDTTEIGITPVEATLFDRANGCFPMVPTAARVKYRADGGTWTTVDATISGDRIDGSIPELPEGTFVEWYVEVDAEDGGTAYGPPVGEIAPYTFYVGGVLPIFCTDFETDDAGFTHELVSGDDTLGADDWQWGRPLGEGGDPDAAFSGTHAWGNDLGEGDYNGEYQAQKTNRLSSPVIGTDWYQRVFLSYRRWLTVEDGQYDHARIVADDQEVWTNWDSRGGTDHTVDAEWMAHVVDLEGAGDDGSVQIGWEIESDQGLNMGGWTIDDVCVYAPATVDNRLAINDFVASDGEDGKVVLTWTNPRHAPVDRVVVVRKEGGFPTGPTDGAVVYEDADPELETAVTAEDTTAQSGIDEYYAVYAGDGEAWLTYTIEGRNADVGSMTGTGSGGVVPGGCACSSDGSAAAWLAAPLALLVLRRRKPTRV